MGKTFTLDGAQISAPKDLKSTLHLVAELRIYKISYKILHLEPLNGEGDSEENAGGQAHVATALYDCVNS